MVGVVWLVLTRSSLRFWRTEVTFSASSLEKEGMFVLLLW